MAICVGTINCKTSLRQLTENLFDNDNMLLYFLSTLAVSFYLSRSSLELIQSSSLVAPYCALYGRMRAPD